MRENWHAGHLYAALVAASLVVLVLVTMLVWPRRTTLPSYHWEAFETDEPPSSTSGAQPFENRR